MTGNRVWSELEEGVWMGVRWGWNELGCGWCGVAVERIRMVLGDV